MHSIVTPYNRSECPQIGYSFKIQPSKIHFFTSKSIKTSNLSLWKRSKYGFRRIRICCRGPELNAPRKKSFSLKRKLHFSSAGSHKNDGENSKTDPPEKPNAKLLKELKKMIYIKMHFQIRKRAKLSETRSQLYRKLWYWSKAYSLQNRPLYTI